MTSARRLFAPPDVFDHNSMDAPCPLYAVKDVDDEKVMTEWTDKAVLFYESFYRPWHKVMIDNVLVYEGIHWANQDLYTHRYIDRQKRVTRRSPRVVINRVADFVDQWVSSLTKDAPAVRVYPANAEDRDRVNAKISQQVLDYIWYVNRKASINRTAARMGKICGNAYIFETWDPTRGDLHPQYVEQLRTSGPTPRQLVVDSYGMPVEGTTGDPLMISIAKHIGDVKHEVVPPWYVWEEMTTHREEINYVIRWSIVDVDALRIKYPDRAKKITAESGSAVFDENYNLYLPKKHTQTIQFELFHKSCEYLPGGRYIKWVKGEILENMDNPYAHGGLPYQHWGDLEIPDRTLCQSFIQRIFPIQHQLNAVASLVYKALVLYSHPKFVMQAGSCNIEQLVDESTVLAYDSAVPPTLMTYNPVARELFEYMGVLEGWLNKQSAVFELAEGVAPSGIRANSALGRIEEQQEQRRAETVANFKQTLLVDDAKLTLAIAGQFYRDDDERLARVLGKNNEYQIVSFKSANLGRPYDIRPEMTSAFSQSRAGKIEELTQIQANVRFDPLSPFTREQFMQALQFQNVDELKDAKTKAINCASSENEDLLSENFAMVELPSQTEDLITHWNTHREAMQDRVYKGTIPQEYRQAFELHFFETEKLMFDKAMGQRDMLGNTIIQGNIVFQQRLQVECPDWPMLFPLPSPEMMQPIGAGSSPNGNGAAPSEEANQ